MLKPCLAIAFHLVMDDEFLFQHRPPEYNPIVHRRGLFGEGTRGDGMRACEQVATTNCDSMLMMERNTELAETHDTALFVVR